MPIERTKLLERICEQYQQSGDFNGLALHTLDTTDPSIHSCIVELIREGEVDLVRGDGHPNPHIKAFPAESIELQLEKIEREGLGTGCLYPSPTHLKKLAIADSEPAPYTRALKLGEPQLSYRVFDLRVLEWYRNDPRFVVEIDDIHGRIHQRSETTDAAGTVLRDQLEFLEFGFAYDEQYNRAIAVFLRYLHDLPTDQQQYLSNYELPSIYKLHPDFYRTQIIGDFPERISIYDAFLEEKRHINELSRLIGKPPLFNNDREEYKRPTGFGILIRPTKKEFGDFALMLDQLLSDDLNRDFFKDEIPTNEILTREDGTTITQAIGTITLLERWIRKYFKPNDPTAMDQLFQAIREVRKARQKPAHRTDNNTFDQKYIRHQRDLMLTAFDAVRTIRMILENHPKARGYEVPDWLREGRVWAM
jgi:hypothetical protein